MRKVEITVVYRYDAATIDYSDLDRSAYDKLFEDGRLESWPPETLEEKVALDTYDLTETNRLEISELDTQVLSTRIKIVEVDE